MIKEEILDFVDKKFTGSANEIMKKQIELFYSVKDELIEYKKYNIGDEVVLAKGTLLHGTYKNIDGLKEIIENGLVASDLIGIDRKSKYPACVGVWNLKKGL